MRPRIAIVISFVAFVLLILIQGYSISQTFRNKKAQFDRKYAVLVNAALQQMENESGGTIMDSMLIMMDDLSLDYVFETDQLVTHTDSVNFRKNLLNHLSSLLASQTQTDQYISKYLEGIGAESEMKSGFLVREFTLLDWDREFPVLADSSHTTPASFRNALLAKSYTFEGNNFRLTFEYYVDFPRRNRIIYREMTLTLILAMVTLLVVLFVFILTARNMLIQKKISDMKSDFINNMTHELKTPLSTIAVATTTLSDDKMMENREKVREISRLINRQNKHLTQLIDRILDISIWEKDQVRLKKKKVHIWEFMKEKLEAFRIEHGGDGVTITEEYDLQKDYVPMDEIHMTTVINNLLSNAVKYCEKKPEIDVRVSLNDRLHIRISDNGIGIRKDDQKHIFDKFYRVGKGDFKTVRGLGLGLYYVKQIVNAHDGEIYLTSNPGKGSTFTITMPTNNEHPAG